MNNDLYKLFYNRAKEVQPQIQSLVKNLQEEGLSPEDIIVEVSFALINEGYRLYELKNGVKVNIPHLRRLQTKIDTNTKES